MQVVGAVLLLALTVPRVLTQCFTDDDNLIYRGSTDLSGITSFALDLFKELLDPVDGFTEGYGQEGGASKVPVRQKGNLFFSPYSVWSALTLAYFGSAGNTEDELRSTLHLQDKVSTLKSWRALEFLYMIRQMNKNAYTLQLANRVFFDKSISLTPCVNEILMQDLQVIDFSKTDQAVSIINSWVSEVTRGHIQNLLQAKDLMNAPMVLANAAFFKGTWLYQFPTNSTRKQQFHTTLTDFTVVNMMRMETELIYGENNDLGAHILELPYTGEEISMYIFLPFVSGGDTALSTMQKRLNSSSFKKALEDLSVYKVKVEVGLPKFKLEETLGNELMMALNKMGINDLFDGSLANLTTFSSANGLNVGSSIHKAFVEVGEEGTEAAAATALITGRSLFKNQNAVKFICNRPFMFVIHDNFTKNILFIGTYVNPKVL